MAEVTVLPPQQADQELTAKRRSKTLKDHEEAFMSINGRLEDALPDPSTEISGIIAEIMKLPKVTRKEVNEAGRLIRNASGKKIRLTEGSRMVWKAMGYTCFSDANKHNEGKEYFDNLNFDRKDLLAITAEYSAAERIAKDKVKAFVRPMFEKVFAIPYDLETFGKEKMENPTTFLLKVSRYLEHLGWVPADTRELWDIGHAFAFRYGGTAGLKTKKSLFRHKGYGTPRLVVEACRELQLELTKPQ